MPTSKCGTAVIAAIAALGALSGCQPYPETDLGAFWVERPWIDWISWSPEGDTLYWVEPEPGDDQIHALYSMNASTRVATRLLGGLGRGAPPQVTDDGSTVFYAGQGSDYGHVRLMKTSIPASAGDGVEIASDVSAFLIAGNGTRVATAGEPDSTIIDVATGAALDIGSLGAVAFSPDGTRLLVGDPAAMDAETNYAVIDPSNGAKEFVAFPIDEYIDAVLTWDANRPRTVLSRGEAVDLGSSERTDLQVPRVEALSGEPAQRAYVFGWTGDCLGTYTDDQGETVCGWFQWKLLRVSLVGGRGDVVALSKDSYHIAVSQNGRRLATVVQGAIIDTEKATGIMVKELPARSERSWRN